MDNFRGQLSDALRNLAASAAEQRSHLQELGVDADELALEYDDLFRLADVTLRNGELTQGEYDALKMLNTQLDAMSGPEKADLWTLDALQSRPEWTEVRRLSAQALAALDHASATT